MDRMLTATMMVKEGSTIPKNFPALASHMRRQFNQHASSTDLMLDWNEKHWPVPRVRKTGLSSELQESPYWYLAEPQYQSDIAVCVVPEVRQLDSAIAHMLFEQKETLQHLFVVTTDTFSSHQASVLRTIDIPLAIQRCESLYVPVAQSSVLDTPNSAMDAGYLSVHRAAKFDPTKLRGYLDLAYLRKTSV